MSDTVTQATENLASLPAEIKHQLDEAFGAFSDKVMSNQDKLAKANPQVREEPKSWFADPFAVLDSIGMGYRNAPTYLTHETLRQVGERDTFVASVRTTRLNQVAAFARSQANRYSVGFKVQPRFGDKLRQLSRSEKDRIQEITFYLLHGGRQYNVGRDSIETFFRKFVNDSLIYDQACFEKVRSVNGRPYQFDCVDASTIRIAQPKILKGTPPSVAAAKRDLKYVQLINASIVSEFTADEMAFSVRNPRSNVKTYGYGLPEIETLMTTVTSHLWAEEWNRRLFSQGSTIKGVLNIKGNLGSNQFEAFKRQWYSQVSGVSNAWKTPLLNGEEVQFVPLQMNNTEMGYQMWMEYLCKIVCALFQIDPAEINFDLRGGVGQQPVFMSTNEAQQKVSKDRGLQPLLRFVENEINRHIVWEIDPRFEMVFVGLDAKTEEQAQQLRIQQVQNTHTLNEVRALDDLPPVPHGDIVLNPTYTAYLLQQAQASQQQAMMQQQGGSQGGGDQQAPQAGPQQMGPGAGQDAPQPPTSPYANQFAGKPHDREEADAADELRDFDEKQGGQGPKPTESSSSDSDEEPITRYLPTLHRDDWASTMRSSVQAGDLRKSDAPAVVLYDLIDLD